MSTQFEDRLRDAMDQATAQVKLRPGLAARASQHRQRRRVTARVLTAAGTAAMVAAGLAAAGAAGAFGSAGTGTQQASYTAYVVRHVEHALAAPAQDNTVQYARSTYQPGTLLQPAGPFAVRVSHGSPSSPWAVGYSQRWMYHGSARATAFGPSGRTVFDLGAKLPAATASGSATSTAPGGSSRCRRQAGAGRPGSDQLRSADPDPGRRRLGRLHPPPAELRRVLGRLRSSGFDGVNTIKIVSKQGGITLWVRPDTYLPVRLILDQGRINAQTDFRWLPPTPANLAQLKVAVPAGFSQVPPPYTQSQAG